MLCNVEEDIPEFLLQRSKIAFCHQLRLHKNKSSIILTRDFMFYEFSKKQLLHHIDLKRTCLQQVAAQLQSYQGPISSFLIREDLANTSNESTCYSMLQAIEELPLSFGKYVWLGQDVYLLLRCWDKLVVLRRPTAYGANFELTAQYYNLTDYRLVMGEIKYQAYVDLHFTNGKRTRTNFQSANSHEQRSPGASASCSNSGLQRLVQRINRVRVELAIQSTLTQQDFERLRELQSFGPPGQRSLLLDELHLIRRCGDVWTRVCGDELVLGIMLANSTGRNRLSILRNVRPLLQLDHAARQQPTSSLNYEHRIYELPMLPDCLPPDDYNEQAQFLASQEREQTQKLNWQALSPPELLPECSAVLLVRLHLAELVALECLQLLVLYDLQQQSNSSSTRQVFLSSINLVELLQQPHKHALSFEACTLHQDFLATVMIQHAHCVLQLHFQDVVARTQFQQQLVSSLGFELTETKPMSADTSVDDVSEMDADETVHVQRIFYQRQKLSPWNGTVLLSDTGSNHWHFYAHSESTLCLLVRLLLRDQLKLHCNVSLLERIDCNTPAVTALHLKATLREELAAWLELLQQNKSADQRQLHRLQMNSDLVATMIKPQVAKTEQSRMTSIPPVSYNYSD